MKTMLQGRFEQDRLNAAEHNDVRDRLRANSSLTWLCGLAALFGVLVMPINAGAAPVVVGSVNPDTRQVTIFSDLLVKRFMDGTPINNFYGGYDGAAKSYLMVRAGKTPAGRCQSDAFKLVRLSGNRLAIADGTLAEVPWNGIGKVPEIKTCFSNTCQGSCQVLGDESTPLDLTDYKCSCSTGGGSQKCEEGLLQLHDLKDIIFQTPIP